MVFLCQIGHYPIGPAFGRSDLDVCLSSQKADERFTRALGPGGVGKDRSRCRDDPRLGRLASRSGDGTRVSEFHDGILAESGTDMIYLQGRVRCVPGIPSDRRDIPQVGSLTGRGHFRTDKFADLTVIRFPVEICRGQVQLFYPEF